MGPDGARNREQLCWRGPAVICWTGLDLVSRESEVYDRKPEVAVGGYQFTILSCIFRRRYQATTSEDIEDLAFAEVIYRVFTSVKVV
jgi:hypothetical protein